MDGSPMGQRGTRVTGLARRENMTKQGMSELIGQGEAMGLVRRTVDPGDRRVKIVRFTRRGLIWLAACQSAVEQAEREMRAELGSLCVDGLGALSNTRGSAVLNSSSGKTRNDLRAIDNGRGDRIRTCDPLLPKQMRYQAALLPDTCRLDRQTMVDPEGYSALSVPSSKNQRLRSVYEEPICHIRVIGTSTI